MERQPLLGSPEEEGISSYKDLRSSSSSERQSVSIDPMIDIPASARNKCYRVMEGGLHPWDKIVQTSIMLLIVINVVLFILSTVTVIENTVGVVLNWIELVSVSVFTIEYFLRLWCCVEKLTFAVSGPFLGRVRYVLTLTSLVDLISFVPYWAQFIIEWARSGDPFNTDSVSFIAAIRILRVFQLLKANKYVHAIEILKVVFKRNRDILLTTGAMAITLFLITSTALYFAQLGDRRVTFQSIPDAMYTAVLLLSAQGFNGMDRMTPIGTWVVVMSCLFSIAIFAVPTSIFASGFDDINTKYKEIRKLKKEQARLKKREEVAKAREKGIYIRTPPTSSDSENDVPIPAPLSLNGDEIKALEEPEEEPTFIPAVRLAPGVQLDDAEDDGSGISPQQQFKRGTSSQAVSLALGALAVKGVCPHCHHDVEFDLKIGVKSKEDE